MALNGSISIIWLDAYIGLADECKGIKKLFQSELASAAAIFPVPVDPINEMICCISELAAPISFAPSIPDALDLIEAHLGNEEKVIVITSGSLGNDLISGIQERNFDIHSYYIFCGKIMNHVEWASEKLADGLDIIMFDFEIDLLLRLSRELSKQLIENGRNLLGNDPHSALKYFECARALAEKAVERDAPKDEKDTHRPSISHRRLLDGDNGLIAQAKRACNDTSNS